MTIITVDFETYYDRAYSLSKITTEEYIRHELFDPIGVAVKVNDGAPLWFSGTPAATKKFLGQFPWDEATAVAHNAMFDMAILNWHFDIRPKRIADTLSMARALHGTEVGGSLKAMAEFYNVGVKGDEVINAINKGRLDFTPEELERYGAYCINDVDLTYKLFAAMAPQFPVVELRLIDLTIRMFTEPVLEVDAGRLAKHLEKVVSTKQQLLDKALISKDNLMSNGQLAETLRHLGVEPPVKISPTTGKETYAFAKTDEDFKALLDHENPIVQFIVAARLGVKSTLEETRTERMLAVAERGTLPIPLRYYAAHTGRWGGDDKVNMQNLPRKSPLKKAILAPEGYTFIDCDSSQIEARTLAWLAEQQDLVEFFEKNNAEIAAGVPKEEMQFDPYKIMASQIYGVPVDGVTDDQRFVGKTTILGCFGPDTQVLTNNGWKRIVEVQATDTLWDGEEWVSHEGVIPQGVKEVLTVQGLTATLDHEILTEHGWQEWSEVATNPSLFRSAIDRANWKSFDGSSTTNQLAVLPGGTPWCGVPAGGKDEWTGTTSRPGALHAATNALRTLRLLPESVTGGTKLSSLISNIASAYSTVSQAVSDVVTALAPRLTLTTVAGVSMSMRHGGSNGRSFCGTSYHFRGGMIQSETSTVWTIPKGMNRVISASLRAVKMLVTNARPAPCKQRLMTYDIAYAGPRNRYTVATDAGPIIVHNCGYGMGAAKFQAQLKTFNVSMDLDECKRIINVYRETYPMIPALWRQAGEALDAVANNQTTPLGRAGVLQVEGYKGIRLPNGLYMKYPNLRWQFSDGKQEMVYDQRRGKATLTTRIYGGKCVENVCQALARIVIGEQMLMIARRLRVVMTVHDAVGAIAPVEEADDARRFIETCMRIQPKWAVGLPLNCESKMGASYGG